MTLFLVRHANAGHRASSDPNDLERALDTYGLAQAEIIAGYLAPLSIGTILTSSALRCQQTIAPLAAHVGIEAQVHPSLLEGSSIGRVMELVRGLPDGNIVLCSHGDIIPDVIRILEVGGTRVGGQRRWNKGSIWQIERSGEMLTDASYVPLPEPGIAAS